MTDRLELTLPNQPAAIPGLQDRLESFARQCGLEARTLHDVQLALEEHLTNVLSYAYDDQEIHQIDVRLRLDAPVLRVVVVDDGRPFNPLEQPAPDVSKPIEERPIGGLGIHMMRNALDEMEYRREDGKNILVMVKRA